MTQPAGIAQENIRQLQHLQSFEIQLTRLLGGWLPGIKRWEVKHKVGRHLWEDAQHSRELRTRLWELRVPNPDRGVEEAVLPVIKALAKAQHDYELLAGIYLVLKPELLNAYETYLESTYDVYDAPSVPMLEKIIAEEKDQIAWAKQAIPELVDSGEKNRQVKRWKQYTEDVLAAAGGASGMGETEQAAGTDSLPAPPPPGYSTHLPFPEAKRDDRFEVTLGGGTPPDPNDRRGELLWQFSNYGQEMQAAESIGSVLWEVEDMPWEFYYDLARHCWDEVRHSKLGETRLAELGYHLSDFPQSVGSYAWRQLIDPLRRYCALTYIIEAGSFDYKHRTYQQHIENGDTESAQAVLYDIMDETMHVRLGHKWVPELMEHYGYEESIDELVEECRAITEKHTVSPEQRKAAARQANGTE